LNIRLGEDAAARGDRVELGVAGRQLAEAGGVRVQEGRQLAEAGGVRVQEGRHLVDEGTGATRAGAVHTLLGGGVQVGELGVLAAQFDDDVDFGVEALGGLGPGDDFLDEGDSHGAGGRPPAPPPNIWLKISEKSKPCAPPNPPKPPNPPAPPPMPCSNAAWPYWSYMARFSLSDKVS